MFILWFTIGGGRGATDSRRGGTPSEDAGAARRGKRGSAGRKAEVAARGSEDRIKDGARRRGGT